MGSTLIWPRISFRCYVSCIDLSSLFYSYYLPPSPPGRDRHHSSPQLAYKCPLVPCITLTVWNVFVSPPWDIFSILRNESLLFLNKKLVGSNVCSLIQCRLNPKWVLRDFFLTQTHNGWNIYLVIYFLFKDFHYSKPSVSTELYTVLTEKWPSLLLYHSFVYNHPYQYFKSSCYLC